MMPRGLDLFQHHFADYTDRYVLIGGTACEIAMAEADLEFRATKDLDIVLTIEALDAAFSARFWAFVKAGGYTHQRADDNTRSQCYRFIKPADATYPVMLELFARRPELLVPPAESRIIPIPMDEDASSLSAILMDEDYYALVQQGRRIVQGLSCLGAEALIPLKAKAFLDLSARKAAGENVDSQHIKKHKNDIFRLFVLLAPDQVVSTSPSVRADLASFIGHMRGEPPDLRSLGIRSGTVESVLGALQKIYGLV